MVGLHLVVISWHRRREPVLRELRQLFVMLIRLSVLYPALFARARGCRVEELPDGDQLNSMVRHEMGVCEDSLV